MSTGEPIERRALPEPPAVVREPAEREPSAHADDRVQAEERRRDAYRV
jgi:hypothetical protein